MKDSYEKSQKKYEKQQNKYLKITEKSKNPKKLYKMAISDFEISDFEYQHKYRAIRRLSELGTPQSFDMLARLAVYMPEGFEQMYILSKRYIVDVRLEALHCLGERAGEPSAQERLLQIAQDKSAPASVRCEAALYLTDEAKKRQVIENCARHAVADWIEYYNQSFSRGKCLAVVNDSDLYQKFCAKYYHSTALVKDAPDRATQIMILQITKDTGSIASAGKEAGFTQEDWIEVATGSQSKENAEAALKMLDEQNLEKLAQGGDNSAKVLLAQSDPVKYADYLDLLDKKSLEKTLGELLEKSPVLCGKKFYDKLTHEQRIDIMCAGGLDFEQRKREIDYLLDVIKNHREYTYADKCAELLKKLYKNGSGFIREEARLAIDKIKNNSYPKHSDYIYFEVCGYDHADEETDYKLDLNVSHPVVRANHPHL